MEKKYILVTGACGGMGMATVKLLTEQGYTVFALDRTEYAPTDGVISVTCDLSDEKQVETASEKVREYTDSLFAVVHFAGIYMLDSLVEIGTDSFDKILDINLRGAFLVNKAFLPFLSEGSRIIITTSELAPLDPLPFTGIYAVTKGALDKYAYSLRMELQLLGISVSVLRAGAVKTDMLGVSTTALDKFVENTKLYSCNATRFKNIVERVEARNITTDKLGEKVVKILCKSRPRFAYSINRNPLLLMLNILPKHLQLWTIKQVLK